MVEIEHWDELIGVVYTLAEALLGRPGRIGDPRDLRFQVRGVDEEGRR